jgi:hypothetical protein
MPKPVLLGNYDIRTSAKHETSPGGSGMNDGGGSIMIARHWKGWTKPDDADAYEKLLKGKVLPGLRKDVDYQGGYVLRRDGANETEFVVVNFFASIQAVRRFAGDNYEVAVFEPEAELLLSRKEPTAAHYEVRVNTMEK